MRNGACGEVVAVDPAGGGMVIDFIDADGRVHRVPLPPGYVAEHVEHAYGLTDYAIQGRTLTRSRSMIDDASTAPGAYVATTRGRLENRLYIVDGDVPDLAALDVSHGDPEVRNSTLEQVAAHLDIRWPEPLFHVRDPILKRALDLAASLVVSRPIRRVTVVASRACQRLSVAAEYCRERVKIRAFLTWPPQILIS